MRQNGFTLIEAVVALSILMVSVSLIVGGYIFLEKNSHDQLVQDSLDLDLRLAAARLQNEMLLTSLSAMTYYPATATKYTAVSFPSFKSGTPDGKEVDKTWDATIIYHMYRSGDEQMLLRTEFYPRDNSLSAAERQSQLERVVADGDGLQAANGTHAQTKCLFRHVFEWTIEPQGSCYDGYSEQLRLDQTADLGTIQMASGQHKLTITATGMDERSSGRKIGLDTFHFSTSGLECEAETQTATGSQNVDVEYNASGTWSGYHQLTFMPSEIGESFDITFYNDRWEDTNFSQIGGSKSNVTVGALDESYSPADLALRLDGNSTNWQAEVQTGDSSGMSWSGPALRGAFVRVLLRGSDMSHGSSFGHDGQQCRIAFAAADSQPLLIRNAYIDELKPSLAPIPDTVGNPRQLTFNNISENGNECSIAAGTVAWSDFIDFPIHLDKSYAVTFQISDAVENCNPKIWKETNNITGSCMLPGSLDPEVCCLTQTNWSSIAELVDLDAVVAVDMLHTTYPECGVYISAPVDTQMQSPQLDSILWTEDCPSGSDLNIKVRTADSPDMSDAPSWESISAIPSPGYLNSIDYKRYIQYQAILYSNDGFTTPKLRDLTIQWPGETRMVDVGGVFVNGPEYGQFEATVDDQLLSSPLRVTLRLQEEIRGLNKQMKTVYAEASFELTPRNSNIN